MATLTPEQLIEQSKAMLAQTAAEGDKPFFGSSYDINKPITTDSLNLVPSPTLPPAKTGGDAGLNALIEHGQAFIGANKPTDSSGTPAPE